MSPIEKLTELFEKFPGIGPRQARRFVHYLLTAPAGVRNELAEFVKKVGTESAQCKLCYRWFVKNENKAGLCNICGNSSREQSLLFIVEKDADIENVENSGFKGLYFVLGGTVPLAAEEPLQFIRGRELMKRIEGGSFTEIILGLSATAEGDHTRQILQEKLIPVAKEKGFTLTSLGRGLSTGSELEYADPETIAQALSSRH